jgi:hypothetical protein
MLRAKPSKDSGRSPLLVWINSAFPQGEATRYDLRFIGYRDGEFDLADYLTRDGGGELPPIRVWVSRIQPSTVPGELDRRLRVTPAKVATPDWASRGVAGALAAGWVACLLWALARRWGTTRRPVAPALAAAQRGDRAAPKPELLALARLGLEGQLDEAKKIRLVALWREWSSGAGAGHYELLQRWALAPSADGATETAATRLFLDLLGGGEAQPG